MRKAPGKFNSWCCGRPRAAGTQTLLVLITLCVVFITVQGPQFLGPSIILPYIKLYAPLDAIIEEGLVVGAGSSSGHNHHQRKLIANDWERSGRRQHSDDEQQVEEHADDARLGSPPSKLKSGDRTQHEVGNDKKTSSHEGRSNSATFVRASLGQPQEKNHPNFGLLQFSHKREVEDIVTGGHELVKGDDVLLLQVMVDQAWHEGASALKELEELLLLHHDQGAHESVRAAYKSIITSPCPSSISMTGRELEDVGRTIPLPCGLVFGSSINLIATPRHAHSEYKPSIARVGDGESKYVMVSQFGLELHGAVEKEEDDKPSKNSPPRILHLNPRLRGDWSWKPVIEHNTFYQGRWGSGQRCEGWPAPQYEETVDGQLKCEAWLQDDDDRPRPESERSWWLHSFLGRSDKGNLKWRYPFAEGQLFILNLRAGVEGFHLTVNGRHISSFPYHWDFVVEEVTGFSLYGDLDLHSVTINALPLMHPSYNTDLVLEEGQMWKARPSEEGEIDLFVGVMSSSNHFAQRMAVRKTWFQSCSLQSSKAVARFFVALHADKNVNLQLRKEADYYGDMILLSFIDHYDIVVLKTIAIFEYGIHNVTAKYIMKTDDDTFVRVDSVLAEVKATAVRHGLYMGRMNEFHRPLRTGKWAVTFEEWPERIYPTYANGPGYILSKDIAQFIVSRAKAGGLRLFKMEDVSVGLWVGQYAREKHVEYENSARFSEAGCISDYLTAHYQSPQQMMCLWDRLLATGVGKCC